MEQENDKEEITKDNFFDKLIEGLDQAIEHAQGKRVLKETVFHEESPIGTVFHPIWSQFVKNKNAWIGGELKDSDMEESTIIQDISLEPNGEDSALFLIAGVDYSCGFDVIHGGVGSFEMPEPGVIKILGTDDFDVTITSKAKKQLVQGA